MADVPFVRIMYAAREQLEVGDALANLTALPDLKIRWARNRYTTRQERPCVAIAFVSDAPVDDGAVSTNPDETVRALALDIIVDMEVETEASAEANQALETPVEQFDPTGLANLASVLAQAYQLLRACCQDPLRDSTTLGKMVDWVQDVSIDDDEDLPDDDGRLVGRVNVLYRTSSWDPMQLLER